MKRTVSLMLLLLFLFNVGGYNLLIWLARIHSDKAMATKIEAGTYDTAHTIELAIPVHMPYLSLEEKGYQRAKGRFEYQGELYKLIKHRVENDTVYIICIKDVEEKRIVKTITDYAKASNDLTGDDSRTGRILGKLIKDYSIVNSIKIPERTSLTIAAWFITFNTTILSGISVLISPPPEA